MILKVELSISSTHWRFSVTTDFTPAMLFEKTREMENICASMAKKTEAILGRRLAFANWARTAADDVRLVDFQEWTGALTANRATHTDPRHEPRRRVRWVNGPPYFAEAVSEDIASSQAVGHMENVQQLANGMAAYITQDGVGKKFVLLDEVDLPKPAFYQSAPPWLDFVNATDIAKWEAARRSQ